MLLSKQSCRDFNREKLNLRNRKQHLRHRQQHFRHKSVACKLKKDLLMLLLLQLECLQQVVSQWVNHKDNQVIQAYSRHHNSVNLNQVMVNHSQVTVNHSQAMDNHSQVMGNHSQGSEDNQVMDSHSQVTVSHSQVMDNLQVLEVNQVMVSQALVDNQVSVDSQVMVNLRWVASLVSHSQVSQVNSLWVSSQVNLQCQELQECNKAITQECKINILQTLICSQVVISSHSQVMVSQLVDMASLNRNAPTATEVTQ